MACASAGVGVHTRYRMGGPGRAKVRSAYGVREEYACGGIPRDRVDIRITSQWVVSSTLMVNNKSVYDT